MGKVLSWVLMALVGYLAWRLVGVIQRKAEAARRAGAAGESAAQAGRKAVRDERIVPCAHCGVHFPASEAVEDGGRLYCSPAHRDAARAADRAA